MGVLNAQPNGSMDTNWIFGSYGGLQVEFGGQAILLQIAAAPPPSGGGISGGVAPPGGGDIGGGSSSGSSGTTTLISNGVNTVVGITLVAPVTHF